MPRVETSSAGMTATYSEIRSGRTNRIVDHTARFAIQAANLTPHQLDALHWVECVWAVFMEASSTKAGSANSRRLKRMVGQVLYYRALLGWTFAKIASTDLLGGRKVSTQRAYQLYDEAVDLVLEEAIRRGLVRD